MPTPRTLTAVCGPIVDPSSRGPAETAVAASGGPSQALPSHRGASMHHSRRSSGHTARPTLTTTPPRGRGGRPWSRCARLASAAARRSRCTRALQLPQRPAKHDTQPGHAAGSCGVKARAWDHASGRARCRMDRLTRLGRAGVVRARCGECTPAMPKLGPYADALGRAGAPRRGTHCGRCGSRTTALIG